MDFNSPEILLRRQNLPRNLTEFVEKFNQETNFYLKISDLNGFFRTSWNGFQKVEDESEQALFFQFASKIPELFDDVSRFNNNTGNEILEGETKIKCYHFILDFLKQSFTVKTTASELQIILQTSLILLYKSLRHCEDCENIYGDSLEHFKSHLATFYNKICDVIEDLNLKFPGIMNPKLHSNQIHFLKPIISELNKLCQLLFVLDSGSGLNMYKTLVNIIEHYREMGRFDLQIDPILIGLFSEIKNIGDEFKVYINNKQQVPDDENSMFVFKLNLVKKIIKIFPSFIEENPQSTIHLMLNLYELIVLCYHKLPADNNSRGFQNILAENILLMLQLFYSEQTFMSSVLLLNSKDVSSDLQTSHLLLKLSALNILVFGSNKFNYDRLPEKIDVIQNVFLMLNENTPRNEILFVSLKLPMSTYNVTKSLGPKVKFHLQRIAPLYDHTFTSLSSYSEKLADSDLQNMENFVIDLLVKSSNVSVTLLISDVWIFQLRNSSVENLFTRCLSFSKRLTKLPSDSVIVLLFKRMIKFLPLNLKEKLFMQNEQLKDIINEQGKTFHQYGAPHLNNKFEMKIDAFKRIPELLDELKKQDFKDDEQLIRKACCILELCATSVNVLEIQEFLRIVEFATQMFKSEVYKIQIAVLTFLRALNYKKFNHDDPMFANVRTSLAVLFNEALKCKNYIVRLEGLSIFYAMAMFTEIKITQEAMAKFPALFPAVKSFVSLIPESGFIAPVDKFELLEKQVSSCDDEPKPSDKLSDESKAVLSLLKPS